MGQVILRPKAGMEALKLAFEALMPVDVLGLAEGGSAMGFSPMRRAVFWMT